MGGRIAWVLLCSGLLPAASASGQARDVDLVFRTLQTPHFEVTYHEPLGRVARRVAAVAERAHGILVPLLDHAPEGRTRILLTDDSDAANGSANAVPYNVIRLYATGPEDLSPLSDYDDWLTELVIHEHTHVLHLDTIGGLPAIINAIFGKVYPPNAVQPRWFLEGLAVHEESAHTSAGRLRSSVFDMYLRMDALEDRLLRLDEMSNVVDRWPHGHVPYLYGSAFVRFIADRHGDEALAAMSHDYGRQLIPYGLNRTARRATGRTFVELYDDFLDETRTRYARVAAEVRAAGLVQGRALTTHGEQARTPRFVDDARVVYWAADGRSRGALRTLDARTGADVEHVVLTAGEAAASPHPDGRHLVTSGLDVFRDIYFFNDLFLHDRESGRSRRLTRGLRARDPDVSPDGRHVVFTVNGAATTHLALAALPDLEATRRILVRSRRYGQIYSPRFSPDGSRVAYSAWHDGRRDLHVVDVRSGTERAITSDRAIDSGPAWSPDGRLLYFSSDRTGIANIYAYELASGITLQVTNVLGGAFEPAVSPDGSFLVYVGYGADGFDLHGMELDPEAFRPAPAYLDRRPPPTPTDEELVLPSHAYDPLPTLWPRSYTLELGEDGFGRQLAVSFGGEDLVGFHAWAARVGVGFERGDVNADLVWQVRRSPVPVGARLFRTIAPRRGLIVGGERRDWIEEAVGGEVNLSYPLPAALHAEFIGLAYSLAQVSKAEPFGGRLDPNDPPPTLPETGLLATLRASWAWSDVARHAFDMTPSEGRSLSFGLGLSHPYLGSRWTAVSATFSIVQYVENPFVEHHVLALRYSGGLSGGDPGRRGTFSIGGFPEVPLLDALVDGIVLGGAAHRGYAPFDRSGTQFHLAQAEYRFPILRLERGVGTLPVFVNRLYGLAFLDVGDAFYGRLDLSTFRFGTGGELLLDFTLGYFLGFTLRLGVARGLSEGGVTQLYANIGVPF